MSESMFASLLHTPDRTGVSEIANSLGDPEQSVARGMDSSVAAVLGRMIGTHVKVAAFTDSVGSGERNLKLSQVRADSVGTELVARGISAERATPRFLGNRNVAADNSTASGRARDRRASLQVTQK
jgi:outer membrane protein OmpA-like peptidoglycan-associated protein